MRKNIALPHVTTRPWTGETHVSNKLPLATTRARTGETHVSNALPLVATRARTGETHVSNEFKKKKPLVATRARTGKTHVLNKLQKKKSKSWKILEKKEERKMRMNHADELSDSYLRITTDMISVRIAQHVCLAIGLSFR